MSGDPRNYTGARLRPRARLTSGQRRLVLIARGVGAQQRSDPYNYQGPQAFICANSIRPVAYGRVRTRS